MEVGVDDQVAGHQKICSNAGKITIVAGKFTQVIDTYSALSTALSTTPYGKSAKYQNYFK